MSQTALPFIMPRENISASDIKILIANARGVCSFPGCGKTLVECGTSPDQDTFLGEIAHIVADSRQGPRGDSELTSEERKRHSNLLLLCKDHHRIIDRQKHTYSVAVLRQMKDDHEKTKETNIENAQETAHKFTLINEDVFGSMLAVTALPSKVYVSDCKYRLDTFQKVVKKIIYPTTSTNEVFPFLLKDKRIYTFHDLRNRSGPFSDIIVKKSKIDIVTADSMWVTPQEQRNYMQLLNSGLKLSLYKKQLAYHPDHRRFYFTTTGPGIVRRVSYCPMNVRQRTRLVVWSPKKRGTETHRDFWIHLAAKFAFRQVDTRQWMLCIRPEFYLTKDGVTPFDSTPRENKRIGRIVTSKKSVMRNQDYLKELHFWTYILSDGSPRIILNFGDQAAFIDSKLTTVSVMWPGVQNDTIRYRNKEYAEDLFSLAEKQDFLFDDNVESAE